MSAATTWIVKKGDRLEGAVNFIWSDHDWSDTEVRSEIRRGYGTPVVEEPTLTVDDSVDGTLTVTVVLTGDETAAMETGTYKMDFVLERDSPAFGPYTPVEIALQVVDRVTE